MKTTSKLLNHHGKKATSASKDAQGSDIIEKKEDRKIKIQHKYRCFV